MNKLLVLAALLSVAVCGQDATNVSKNTVLSSDPPTCITGQQYVNATSGLRVCTSTNTWNSTGGGGSGTITSVTPGTTGGVTTSTVGGAVTIDGDPTAIGFLGGNNNFSGNNDWGMGTTGFLDASRPNDGTTGTLAKRLASLTGANVIKTADGATSGAVGIVFTGTAGTTGNARVIVRGLAACTFDNTSVAGDYVQIASTGGQCHDAGSSRPTSGQIIGRALTAGTLDQSVWVELDPNSGGSATSPTIIAETKSLTTGAGDTVMVSTTVPPMPVGGCIRVTAQVHIPTVNNATAWNLNWGATVAVIESGSSSGRVFAKAMICNVAGSQVSQRIMSSIMDSTFSQAISTDVTAAENTASPVALSISSSGTNVMNVSWSVEKLF